MEQFILDMLGGPDFNTVLNYFLLYLLALWVVFCVWVLVDAHKRYHSIFVALIMAILVFVFNFPALIFYLIIRPEDEYFLPEHSLGGAEVPVAKFIDDNGEIALSLNLQVSRKLGSSPDMNINVAWDEASGRVKLSKQQSHKDKQKSKAKKEKTTKSENNLAKNIAAFRERANSFFSNEQKEKKSDKKPKEKTES